MKYIDLSHLIEDGMITYQGLPAPLICDYFSRQEASQIYDDGSTFQIGKIDMVGNTGTYMDCPFHRFEEGRDFSELFLKKLVNLPGVIVRCPFEEQLEIGVGLLHDLDVAGRAVLFQTGWDRHWRTDTYFEGHPFLSTEAAEFLVEKGAVLAGIDSYNIDDTSLMKRPVHTKLLGADILIIEHMCNMHLIPAGRDFTVTAVPPKIRKVGSFPVRVYASVNEPAINS